MKAMKLALALALFGAAAATTVPLYHQCGGMGGDCTTCEDREVAPCAEGSWCYRQNEWYWQCLEGSGPGPAPENKTVALYGQCGGKGGACADFGVCTEGTWAGFSCAEGSCIEQNEWYSQCLTAAPTNGGDGGDSGSTTTLKIYEQCGGLGAACDDTKKCGDMEFPGFSCESGTTCQRQNEWYWQCLPTPAPEPTCLSVAELATATPELSSLVDAIVAAGFLDLVSDKDLVATVFAPTNEAFAELLGAGGSCGSCWETSGGAPDVATLQKVLQYHVVPGVAAKSTDLTNGQILPTLLEGSDLGINLPAEGGVKVVTQTSQHVPVVGADVMACKAVIHVVPSVLLPELN